jgi:metal-responsive CopG/Arc/MetJ family transcriptional regulator
MKIIAITIPEVLLAEIDEKRKELGISRSEYLRSLVIRELKEAKKNEKTI